MDEKQQFTLRAVFIAVTLLAIASACIRLMVIWRAATVDAVMLGLLWFVIGACFGSGIGVGFSRQLPGAILGAFFAMVLLFVLTFYLPAI